MISLGPLPAMLAGLLLGAALALVDGLGAGLGPDGALAWAHSFALDGAALMGTSLLLGLLALFLPYDMAFGAVCRRAWAYVRPGSDRGIEGGARIGATLMMGAALFWIMVRVNVVFMTSFKNRGLAAFVLAVVTMASFLAAGVVRRALANGLILMLRPLDRHGPRWLRAAFPGLILALAALMALIMGAWLVVTKWEIVDVLPMASLLWPLAALALLWPLASLLARLSLRARWVGLLAGLAIWGALAIQALWAFDPRGTVGEFMMNGTVVSRHLLGLAREALDGDGDGYSALLGGGDCQDSDPTINPGAVEVPNDGLDQDCSGGDLVVQLATPAAATALEPPVAKRVDRPRRDIIFIGIDAQRPDHLGCYGYERPISPNIDAFARGAVLFERAYALSSYTSKSFPPLMASMYPSEMHRNFNHFTKFFPQNLFYGEVLQEAGYRNLGVFAHWGFDRKYGFHEGFDVWDLTATPKGPKHIDECSSSAELTDRIITLLRAEEGRAEPVHLFTHYMDAHKQYIRHKGFTEFGGRRVDRYDHEVLYQDHHIGRLLSYLEGVRRWREALIIITADHGEAFGEHGIFTHGHDVYEELVRVPLLVRVPGVRPYRVRARVSQIDLAPTMLDAVGLKVPASFRGRSFMGALEAGRQVEERDIYVDLPAGPHNSEHVALISRGFKIHYGAVGRVYRLFNLEEDPGEKRDLARDGGERLGEMRSLLERFRSLELAIRQAVR